MSLDDEVKKIVLRTVQEFIENTSDVAPKKQTPDVMTLTQVCVYLSVTKPTIYNRIKSGLPVSYALGEKSPRFVKSEIDNWLNKKSVNYE